MEEKHTGWTGDGLMKWSVLTPKQIAEIRRRYAQGESSYKLADEYFMSQKGLYAHVADIKRPHISWRRLSDERIQQIRQAYRYGIKPKVIADELRITTATVHRYVADLVKKGA